MKTIHVVSNGVSQAEFPKTSIEKMKMLGLIQPKGSRSITRDGKPARLFAYTGSFDNRRPVTLDRGKW